MTTVESDGSDDGPAVPAASSFSVEELRRRNPVALAMDVLYLITAGFFTLLALEGFWPAVIAAVPLAAMLYFGWRSSAAFFVAQLIAIVAAASIWFAGLSPFTVDLLAGL